MEKAYVLEKEAAIGLMSAGVNLDALRLENITQHLGTIVGIELKPFDKTAVHVPMQEEYDTLMKVLESGGWRWINEYLPTYNPYASWHNFGKETCVDANESFGFNDKTHFEKKDFSILTPEQFYDAEGISSENVEKIVILHDCIKSLLTKRG